MYTHVRAHGHKQQGSLLSCPHTNTWLIAHTVSLVELYQETGSRTVRMTCSDVVWCIRICRRQEQSRVWCGLWRGAGPRQAAPQPLPPQPACPQNTFPAKPHYYTPLRQGRVPSAACRSNSRANHSKHCSQVHRAACKLGLEAGWCWCALESWLGCCLHLLESLTVCCSARGPSAEAVCFVAAVLL